MHPLSLVPSSNQPSEVRTTEYGVSAPSVPALADALRSGGPAHTTIAPQVNERHPIESRIQNWDKHQQETKMESYRRLFGAADPIKREMELSLVSLGDVKANGLGGPAFLHRDVLLGNDWSIDWEDVYKGDLPTGIALEGVHGELGRRFGVN